jgi:predicted AlkP superfamily pyrophosphatase or phosphodiesterase
MIYKRIKIVLNAIAIKHKYTNAKTAGLAQRVLLFLLIGCVVPSPTHGQNLFIMGWDGAGKKNIDVLLSVGLLPNLQSFLDNGGKLIDVETHTQTATIAGWTTIFTGLHYEITGVSGNKPYDGGSVEVLNFWLYNLPYSASIIYQLQVNAEPPLKVGWFTSKKYLSDYPDETPLNEIARNADRHLMISPEEDQKVEDTYIHQLAQAAVEFISVNSDYVVFVHTNPDYFGHGYGENSREYILEFIKSDIAFGAILPFLSSDTIIIITNDHGFDEDKMTHFSAPDCWMATNLDIDSIYTTSKKGANMRDIPYTLLKKYNLTPFPVMNGKSLLR